jgi:hypothetical protein
MKLYTKTGDGGETALFDGTYAGITVGGTGAGRAHGTGAPAASISPPSPS